VRWPMRIPLPAPSARIQLTSSDRPLATVGKAAEMPGGPRWAAKLPPEGAGPAHVRRVILSCRPGDGYDGDCRRIEDELSGKGNCLRRYHRGFLPKPRVTEVEDLQ
jgi:hypothetical protein